MVISLIVSFKLATALAKDMVNLEAAKRIVPNLFQASKQWVLESINQHHQQQQQQQQPRQDNAKSATDAHHQQHQIETASTEYLVRNWLEATFAWFQVIVLWHEPYVSLCALTGLLSSFLLLTYFAPRFYATIMIAIFIYNSNKFWFRHVWPEIRVPPEDGREEEMRLDVDRWTYLHPQLMTLAEFGQFINNLMKLSEQHLRKLLKLRQERPIAFCSLICSVLYCTAYIGNRISGISLVFWSITALVSAPGIYLHLLPSVAREWLRQNIGLKIANSFLAAAARNESALLESSSLSETSSPSSLQAAGAVATSNTPPSSSSSDSTTSTTCKSSVESQALSLFEHLRQRSLIAFHESVSSRARDELDDNNKLQRASSTDVPKSSNDLTPRDESDCNEQQQQQQDKISGDTQRQSEQRKGSDDMSSNESVSLIDSDDDQQDGFVLL